MRPDVAFKDTHHVGAPVLAPDTQHKAAATLFESPPYRFGLGFAGQIGDLCGELLDLPVLDVQGHLHDVAVEWCILSTKV